MPFTVTDWMSFVDGSRKLSELSIPGTHDSASRYIESNRLTTQTDGIREQLDSGIRFIDIRVGYTKNSFQLYHETTFLNLDFGQVRDACSAFLKAHPGETVILSLKKEDKAPSGDNDKGGTFQKRFQKYVNESPTLWYVGKDIPTLGEVRGKIVLFRRFKLDSGTTVLGINADDGFPDNGTKTFGVSPRLTVQDDYGQKSDTKDDKYKVIQETLAAALRPANAEVLFVNFTSAAGIANVDFPLYIANVINPRLIAYFNGHPKGRFGILPMDFQTVELNTLVIRTNPAFLGYLVADGNAKVTGRGSAVPGALAGTKAPTEAIAIAVRPNGAGYYLLAPNGTVYPYGDATNLGNGVPGGTQAVSIAVKPVPAAPEGRGYWILSVNGKVGAHKAAHHGDLGSAKVEAVSIVATPDGGGYWILTASGSVHKFGNAALFGDATSNSGHTYVGMAPTPDGKGYWILAKNGSVQRFGNAGDYGPGLSSGAPARDIAALPDGRGYWILTKSGEVHAFGTAPALGGALPGAAPVGIVVKRP